MLDDNAYHGAEYEDITRTDEEKQKTTSTSQKSVFDFLLLQMVCRCGNSRMVC